MDFRNADILRKEQDQDYDRCSEWLLARVAICQTYHKFPKMLLRFGINCYQHVN